MDKRNAIDEYLEGAREWVASLLRLILETVVVGAWFGSLVLALFGIADWAFSDLHLLTTSGQRIAAWLAIFFWIVVLMVAHVVIMRRKGRQILDEQKWGPLK